MRNTKQRRLIKIILKECMDHPNAERIYSLVRKKLPNISLGTVYRNLELLAEIREIQKLDFGEGFIRFDYNPERHNHFQCLECGCVEDIPFSINLDEIFSVHEWISGRIVKEYKLLITGFCRDCSEKIRGKK